MRVGLTYDLKTEYSPKDGEPPDFDAEFDHPDTIEVISKAISANGFIPVKIGNVLRLLEKIDNIGVDIVFNISEGISGRNRESQVPILLEMVGIPFVGSDALSLGISLDKAIAKKVFIAEGIPTPHFMVLENSQQCDNLDHLQFPLFVKPRFEGSSKGLSESSRVTNKEELKRQVDHIVSVYKQPALVEEFIRGQEFTVAIIGNSPPEVLPVVQIKIDGELKINDKFYTFGHVHDDALEYVCPAPISKQLEQKLSEVALRAYQAIECRDFGRVDIRVDESNNPYVLEINPLPSLSTADVFMVIAKTLGISYEEMIGRILKAALKRYNMIK
ncbi:MAG: ATP-grasp domain-containing protein [Candidatus Omnitrophica bacterium]|nr:ATP-grasp domain-containing protein [Candidatus Omnitrophota bacterium]